MTYCTTAGRKGVKVEFDDGKEFLMKSNEMIEIGEEIGEEEAFVKVVHGRNCQNCLLPKPSLKCSACKEIYYCSRECQKKDFKIFHKWECRAFKKCRPNIPNSAIRLFARLLYAIKAANMEIEFSNPRPRLDGVNRLSSNRKRMTEKDLALHSLLAKGIHNVVDNQFLLDIDSMIELVCILSTNSLGLIGDDGQEIIGRALFPKTLSFINHSCYPNAHVVYNRKGHAVLRAIRQICPGQQIFISYIDIFQNRIARQKQLSDSYHFICDCTACSGNVENPDFSQDYQNVAKMLENQEWNELMQASITISKRIENSFGPFHPEVGIHLLKALKCASLVLDDFTFLSKLGQKTCQILAVTHKDTLLYENARSLVRSLG